MNNDKKQYSDKELYDIYLFWRNASGDIWNTLYYPLTFEQWLAVGKPQNPGTNPLYCNKF